MLRNNKIKMATIMLILISIFTINTGCLNEKIKRTYKFNLQVSGYNDTGNYTLYIPFPINTRRYNTDMLDKIKNKVSDAKFEVFNSSKGICLKLTYYNNLSIELEGNLENFNYEPSMYNYSKKTGKENYWIYSNSNDRIKIKLYFEKHSSLGSSSTKRYTVEGYVEKGWQKINAKTVNVEG